jgi:uncharacterized protein YaiE (UPF0345 family)
MKAVIPTVPEHFLESRHRIGADQWDEMWEGVLHMPPSPTVSHQDFEGELEMWLKLHWGKPNGCRVYHQINVAAPDAAVWTENYRVPDLVMLTPERFHIDQNEYFDGGPDAVVEIRSRGDEAYEKLDFYAKVGVHEVWIIERDSKRPEVYEVVGGQCKKRLADADGWVRSEVVGAEMRAAVDGKLEIRLVGKPDSAAKVP